VKRLAFADGGHLRPANCFREVCRKLFQKLAFLSICSSSPWIQSTHPCLSPHRVFKMTTYQPSKLDPIPELEAAPPDRSPLLPFQAAHRKELGFQLQAQPVILHYHPDLYFRPRPRSSRICRPLKRQRSQPGNQDTLPAAIGPVYYLNRLFSFLAASILFWQSRQKALWDRLIWERER